MHLGNVGCIIREITIRLDALSRIEIANKIELNIYYDFGNNINLIDIIIWNLLCI